jgi:hypothetical protein
MLWIGISLVVASVAMRFAGVALLRILCATHWAVLFGPLPGQPPSGSDARPLFPGLSPADFDDLIKKRRETLRLLPPPIARLAWWRLGLRNWSRAFFWIGMLLLLGRAL